MGKASVPKDQWFQISEEERLYVWHDGSLLNIERPIKLLISNSGRHYVETASGNCYIVNSGWKYLKFKSYHGFSLPLEEKGGE